MNICSINSNQQFQYKEFKKNQTNIYWTMNEKVIHLLKKYITSILFSAADTTWYKWSSRKARSIQKLSRKRHYIIYYGSFGIKYSSHKFCAATTVIAISRENWEQHSIVELWMKFSAHAIPMDLEFIFFFCASRYIYFSIIFKQKCIREREVNSWDPIGILSTRYIFLWLAYPGHLVNRATKPCRLYKYFCL